MKYILYYENAQEYHDAQSTAEVERYPGDDVWTIFPGFSWTKDEDVVDYNPIFEDEPVLIVVNETNTDGVVTLTAKETGTRLASLVPANRPKVEVKYSTNGLVFKTTASTDNPETGEILSFSIPANGKLYLKGKNDTFAVGAVYMPARGYSFEINLKYWSFSCNVKHSLDGFLMAVLNNDTAVTENFELAGLFEGDQNLVSLTDTVLSSKHVPVGAYAYTFANSGLEVMPLLDAEYIEDYGAYEMFKNAKFETLGELRATTLGRAAYFGMFRGSTRLTGGTYPIPNADFVCSDENQKYNSATWAGMFEGCTALTHVPEIMQEKAYCRSMIGMFAGCKSLVTPPVIHLYDLNTGIGHPDTNGANECLAYMFKGCTSLTATPSFLATVPGCGSMYGLQYMFSGCTSLVDAGTLGMSGINSYVCNEMFAGCTSLQTPPDMSKLRILYGQYDCVSMFKGCTSLTAAPILNITRIYHLNQSGHMASMFQGCTSLTTVPSLTIPQLGVSSCQAMFSGCTNLNYIKCIAGNITASNCTTNWVDGVSGSGTFVSGGTADWSTKTGSDGIPAGWTVQPA